MAACNSSASSICIAPREMYSLGRHNPATKRFGALSASSYAETCGVTPNGRPDGEDPAKNRDDFRTAERIRALRKTAHKPLATKSVAMGHATPSSVANGSNDQNDGMVMSITTKRPMSAGSVRNV